MSCKCAHWDADNGYMCSVSGDRCMFMTPSSKACVEQFDEGPDAINNNNNESEEN